MPGIAGPVRHYGRRCCWPRRSPHPGATFTTSPAAAEIRSAAYTIAYNKLPAAADDQRLQMARRLAAADPSMDILGLDVTWAPEFAQAGWILPWAGTYKQQAQAGTLKVPLETATWKNQLYAVPCNSNTQLLWYRDDLVKTPPATWDQMIADAQQLAKEGKPHPVSLRDLTLEEGAAGQVGRADPAGPPGPAEAAGAAAGEGGGRASGRPGEAPSTAGPASDTAPGSTP